MCTQHMTAGTVQKTRAELLELGLEDPSYWNYGDTKPVKQEPQKTPSYIEVLKDAQNAIVRRYRVSCQEGVVERCVCDACIVKRIEETLAMAQND